MRGIRPAPLRPANEWNLMCSTELLKTAIVDHLCLINGDGELRLPTSHRDGFVAYMTEKDPELTVEQNLDFFRWMGKQCRVNVFGSVQQTTTTSAPRIGWDRAAIGGDWTARFVVDERGDRV